MKFWYHTYQYDGTLRVLQHLGDGANQYGEEVAWYSNYINEDNWRVGHAEMLPSSLQWRAVFETEKGELINFRQTHE